MADSGQLVSSDERNSALFLVPDFGPSRRKRQENWTAESTLALVNVWRENIAALRSLKRNGHVYQKIAHQLHLAGFHRTTFEVKTKIGNLTNEYRRERRRLQADGGPSRFKFWDVIHDMMTTDVVSASDGSASREEFDDDEDSAFCNGDEVVFPVTSRPISITSEWSLVDRDEEELEIKQEAPDEEEEELEEKESYSYISPQRPSSTPPSPPLAKKQSSDTHERPKSRKRKFRTEDQRLKIMNLIYEENKRMNEATQRAEKEALALMREQIDLQKQSMLVEERIARAIEGVCRELTESLSSMQQQQQHLSCNGHSSSAEEMDQPNGHLL